MAKLKKPIVIGSSTTIDFPKFGIKKVPAKVDTGADSSSIWASNIREYNGKLSFTLFGLGSPFYTGEVINTRDYHIRSVKNSFGHAESRYQVRLPATIEERSINMRFNLANRGENTYPILIGRRTLHGRFMVDVSKNAKKKYKVLVLKPSPLKGKGNVSAFFEKLEKDNKFARFTFTSYKDLVFIFNGRKLRVKIGPKGRNVTDFDLVHFFIVSSNQDIASALAQHLKTKNVPFVDKAVANYYQSVNKLHQTILMQNIGVRVPKTIFMHSELLAKSYSYLQKQLGSPFILKGIHGRKGHDNYLIKDQKQFKKALNSSKDSVMIAQQFIENNGDYRMLIFGQNLKLTIHRRAGTQTHINNISSGSKATLLETGSLPASVMRMAISAASVLDVDISGVDMVQDKKTGLWYCLEVNESPQLVSSSFIDEKQRAFAEYLEKKLQRLT